MSRKRSRSRSSGIPRLGARRIIAETPAKVPKPRREIDPELLAKALAVDPALDERRGSNALPATGRCHTCDRAISGERRYCGRCLAGRI